MAELGEHSRDEIKPEEHPSKKRRLATVFDAVAGRVGVNGFLNEEHQSSTVKPSKPEEILLRRLTGPQEIPHDYYTAEEKVIAKGQRLPDPELLGDLHAYVADFYEAISGADFDFRSLDETSLIAMGILLEEACKEAFGENGDMVFSEPQSTDQGLPESKWTRHQIIGKIVPRPVKEYQSASDEEEDEILETPGRKRQRRGHQYGGI